MTVEAVQGDPVLFRITRRNGTESIVDQAELDRLDGLKRRAFVGFARCRIYQCDACGKRDAWRESWGWYGSIMMMEDSKPCPRWCSEACRKRLIELGAVPRNARCLDGS